MSYTTAPANVTGLTTVGLDGQVKLQWTNPADSDYAGLLIVRKTGSFPTSISDGAVTQMSAADTQYLDTALANQTVYYYRLYTYDASNNYSTGTSAQQTPAAYVTTDPPSTVNSFAVTPGNAKIVLAWTNPTDQIFEKVLVLRKTGSASAGSTDGQQVYSGNGSAYTDSSLTNGTTYFYTIYCVGYGGGVSAGVTKSTTPSASAVDPLTFTKIAEFASPDSEPLNPVEINNVLYLPGGYTNKFYEMDPSTGDVSASWGTSTDFNTWGVSNYGNNLNNNVYACFSAISDQLYTTSNAAMLSINPSTHIATDTGFFNLNNCFTSLVSDGTNFWSVEYFDSSEERLIKRTGTDGSEIITFVMPVQDVSNIFWLPELSMLIGLKGDSTVYSISRGNGTMAQIGTLPVPEVCRLSYSGGYLWVSDNTRDKIYKLSITY